ncbi:MAG: response regulator [Caulobacteraceae bacterium]|nr:response regulator [Caulobacter sp.]
MPDAAPPPKVLIADDDASIRLVLSHAFTRAGFQVRATAAAATLAKWAAEGEGDVVVTDVVMPDENVFEVLPRIRRARPDLPVIVMSAQTTLLTAVAAAERGAFEYMPKPFDLDDMVAAARRALAPRGAAPPARTLRDADLPLIGRSPAMQAAYRTLSRLLAGDEPVLLVGETGAGKTLAARVLHDMGARRDGPLAVVAVGGLSGAELEARLAGEGGGFARARGGDLLLEAVDRLDVDAQVRLAGLLDANGEGADAPRLLATAGASGEDAMLGLALRHRLGAVELRMPPLREHPEDVRDLAAAALRRSAGGAPPRTLDAEALRRLERHPWPGNVRELNNLMRRLARLHAGARLDLVAVEAALLAAPLPAADAEAAVEAKLAEAVEAFFAAGPPAAGVHERLTAALERPLLRAALAASGGAQLRAAELLGMNRNTLRKRLGDLGLRE